MSQESYEILSKSNTAKLVNHWESGLKEIANELADKLENSIKDTCFPSKGVLNHEAYIRRSGIIEGIRQFRLALEGEYTKFLEELHDAEV